MTTDITRHFVVTHTHAAGEVLRDFETPDILEFIRTLADTDQGALINELGSARMHSIIAAMSDDEIATLLLASAHDVVISLVAHLRNERYAAVLAAGSGHARLQMLLDVSDEVTLHNLANPAFVAFHRGELIGAVREQLNEMSADGTELLLVVDDLGRLLGQVPIARVLANTFDEATVDSVMVETECLPESLAAVDALALPVWNHSWSLPVVDAGDRVVGVINRGQLSQLEPRESSRDVTGLLVNAYLESCSHLLGALIGLRR